MKVIWNDAKRARWDRLTDRHAAALQQDWAYGDALALFGAPALRAEVKRGAETVALAQFATRRFFGFANLAVLTRGPVWTADLSADEKAEALRLIRRSAPIPTPRALFITPDDTESTPYKLASMARVMTGYTAAMLRIDRSIEAVRAGCKGKWRNRLVAAEQAKLRVEFESGAPARDHWLYQAEEAQRGVKGYASAPAALATAYALAHGKKGAATILTARERKGADICAAMLFLRHGAAATYHLGWSNQEGRRLSAHNLLLWRAVEHFQRIGIKSLDLGGVDTRQSPGLARFKLGAGAAPTTYAGTFY